MAAALRAGIPALAIVLPILLRPACGKLAVNASRQAPSSEPSSPSQIVAAEDYLRNQRAHLREGTACLPELQQQARQNGFAMDPALWVDSFLRAPGRLFVVGDAVAGHLLSLGKPGLACSDARPCDGQAPFQVDDEDTWQVDLTRTEDHIHESWQSLKRFRLRSGENTAAGVEGFHVSPEVVNDVEKIRDSVDLLASFFASVEATSSDVLVVGMMGNEFESKLAAFDRYSTAIMREVVNPFPGRVVVLGGSPQHFSRGRLDHSSGQSSCFPSPLPGDVDPPMSDFRNAVWGFNNWKNNINKWSRYVDIHEFLNPLWQCHRRIGDCQHWEDSVISLTIQSVLNAIQKLGDASPAQRSK